MNDTSMFKLLSVSQLEAFSTQYSEYQLLPSLELKIILEVFQWIKLHIAKPHENLGRTGTVCPFVPASLKKNCLWMDVASVSERNKDKLKKLLLQYQNLFLDLEPTQGKDAIFKTFILILPHIKMEEFSDLIDGVQRDLKLSFVTKGTMLGEFHPAKYTPGLHNPNFYSLLSPVPLLVIRYMVEQDLIFLQEEKYTIQEKISFLNAYLNCFGNKLSANYLEKANIALQKLK